MGSKEEDNGLIIPIYINEKIVLDMLAILEDGFSMVSQVTYTEQARYESAGKIEAGLEPSSSILGKFLKINLSGESDRSVNTGKENNVTTEKIHTNVSLLAKFRRYLLSKKVLKTDFNISDINIGDFVEVEGELQKNPLIRYLGIFEDLFQLANIFSDKPELGKRTRAKSQRQQDNKTVKQIKAFSDKLKRSGTVDFILTGGRCTAVLSAQGQYLENDNISEILGGRFKILGKVISICSDESDSINLLRKTALSIMPSDIIDKLISETKNEIMNQLVLPDLVTEIAGPAVIIIPIAIYA